MQIYAFCCGYLEFDRHAFFPDQAPGTRMTIPVSSYLLIHPHERVLFDTGIHRQAIADPVGRLGERRATRVSVRSRVGDEVVSQLAHVGIQPAYITHVINSHFHVDHCGGNEFFPEATFLVQSREMERARSPENPYNPMDFDHPLTYQLVDADYDIFGDGTLVLLPTYGHTPGHQSLWVREGQARLSSRAMRVTPRSIWAGTRPSRCGEADASGVRRQDHRQKWGAVAMKAFATAAGGGRDQSHDRARPYSRLGSPW